MSVWYILGERKHFSLPGQTQSQEYLVFSLPGGLSLHSLGKVSASPLPPARYIWNTLAIYCSRMPPCDSTSAFTALFCIDLGRCFLSFVNKGKVVPGKNACEWKLHVIMCNDNVLSRPHYEDWGNCTLPATAIEWMWAVSFLDERTDCLLLEKCLSQETQGSWEHPGTTGCYLHCLQSHYSNRFGGNRYVSKENHSRELEKRICSYKICKGAERKDKADWKTICTGRLTAYFLMVLKATTDRATTVAASFSWMNSVGKTLADTLLGRKAHCC